MCILIGYLILSNLAINFVSCMVCVYCTVTENSLKVSMATATSKDIGTSDVPLVTATVTITTKSNKSQNVVSKPCCVVCLHCSVVLVWIFYFSFSLGITHYFQHFHKSTESTLGGGGKSSVRFQKC